jgi:hypothetical protein
VSKRTGHTVLIFDSGSGYEGCWHHGDYLSFVDSASIHDIEVGVCLPWHIGGIPYSNRVLSVATYKTRLLAAHIP